MNVRILSGEPKSSFAGHAYARGTASAPPPGRTSTDSFENLPRRSWRLANRPSAAPGLQAPALEHYFPHANSDSGMFASEAYQLLSACVATAAKSVQARGAGDPSQRALGEFLTNMWAMLQNARALSLQLQNTSDKKLLPGLAQRHILEPLRRGQAVTFEGGYLSPRASHFVAGLVIPPQDGAPTSLCTLAFFNRGQGAATYHTTDNEHRIQPFVIQVPFAALYSADGGALLTQLLRMQQVSRREHSGKSFYGALSSFAESCGGATLLGKVGGHPVRRIDLPGQTEQVGGTCTLAGNMSMLWFAMAAWRGAHTSATDFVARHDPLVSATQLQSIRPQYEWLKGTLRDAVMLSAKTAMQGLRAAGNVRGAQALQAELKRVDAWVLQQANATTTVD